MDTTSVVLIYAPWSRDRRGVGCRCFVILYMTREVPGETGSLGQNKIKVKSLTH